jgi:DNA-directed RNA polymerase subunit RPC12/RpoP
MAASGLPTLADTVQQCHELAIYCCDCSHKALVSPVPMAQRVGEDFPVVDLYRRRLLKCTQCGSRNATIRV